MIIEGKGTFAAISRSVELTAGRRWKIFWSTVLFFVPFFLLGFLANLPLNFAASLCRMPVEVLMGCLLNIVCVIVQIVIFLFYWEAIQEERVAGSASD